MYMICEQQVYWKPLKNVPMIVDQKAISWISWLRLYALK